ncbi:MAG: uncharacterized protein KVP18_001770 [Porospora cf. gigantea A]|uniref:uncharacterized protein n=1 Tax=Porospora cf. gigantea A TaxID=2853593 RepID=UPI00355A3FAE|nr:MAG: hypothetical protein KVP18_001770 [Porospora cf. gigantea A]
MAPKEKKTKAQIAAAAAAGGKRGKKKWAKGNARDKAEKDVLFTKSTLDKLLSDIPKSKVITPSIVAERLGITVSLAKIGITHLMEDGRIKQVGDHHARQQIYTRCTTA